MSASNLAPPTIDEYERLVLSSPPCAGLLTPQKALKKIADVDQSGELRIEVLNTCYLAAQQRWCEDPLQKQRKETQDATAPEIKSQRTAVKRLVGFMKARPSLTSWAWGSALLHWKEQRQKKVVFPSILETQVDLSQIFVELLECYDSALKNGQYPTKEKGAWLYRFQAGALLYPDHKPLDTATAPAHDLLNSLLFHLVFIFRQSTSAQPIVRCAGYQMLTSGKPHYDIVATLANAALPKECRQVSTDTDEKYLTVKQIRERVTRLTRQGVKLGNWPQ